MMPESASCLTTCSRGRAIRLPLRITRLGKSECPIIVPPNGAVNRLKFGRLPVGKVGDVRSFRHALACQNASFVRKRRRGSRLIEMPFAGPRPFWKNCSKGAMLRHRNRTISVSSLTAIRKPPAIVQCGIVVLVGWEMHAGGHLRYPASGRLRGVLRPRQPKPWNFGRGL